MLIATDYARKMALDMRLIDSSLYEDHPDNKASRCAKMIAEYYHKYDAQKGTQFVFSDLGTYQPGDGWNVYSEIKRKLTGLRHPGKRGALHSGVQDRQGTQGGDRRHERRNGARAVRFHFHARNGCERAETVCRNP